MGTNTRWANVFLGFILPLTAFASQADGVDLCEPFTGGKVDESVLETMFEAAEVGRLYRMDVASSKVGFCVDSRFTRVEADFKEFHGGMTLSGDGNGKAQTLLMVKAASLSTDGVLTENMIKGARFFDVENFPEILFVGTDYEWTSDTTAVLKGNLTLHGVTRPVTFDVTVTDVEDPSAAAGDRILFKATARISRAEFGMDTMASVVDDNVQLCISVEASKFAGGS
jgi:polyisoprenoid-binding protein YceI